MIDVNVLMLCKIIHNDGVRNEEVKIWSTECTFQGYMRGCVLVRIRHENVCFSEEAFYVTGLVGVESH